MKTKSLQLIYPLPPTSSEKPIKARMVVECDICPKDSPRVSHCVRDLRTEKVTPFYAIQEYNGHEIGACMQHGLALHLLIENGIGDNKKKSLEELSNKQAEKFNVSVPYLKQAEAYLLGLKA